MLIREAAERDWPQVHLIFTAIVTAGETYAYPEGLSAAQTRAYWSQQPPGRVMVAVERDTVLGTATFAPNRPGRGAHIATGSFMVAPGEEGRGVGRALGRALLEWARDGGYRGVQFNAVVETNAAAVHLWQSLGFEILATVPEAFNHPKHGFVGLHLMYHRLV